MISEAMLDRVHAYNVALRAPATISRPQEALLRRYAEKLVSEQMRLGRRHVARYPSRCLDYLSWSKAITYVGREFKGKATGRFLIAIRPAIAEFIGARVAGAYLLGMSEGPS